MSLSTLLATTKDDQGQTVELYHRREFKCFWTRTLLESGAVVTVSSPSYKARELYEQAEHEGTIEAPWPGRLS